VEREKMLAYILDAIPYPIVFVDCDHTIKYLNKAAEYHYYAERGYDQLIGKSIFECHNTRSQEKIREAVEKLKNHHREIFLGVAVNNQRIYINPVRNENGELIGYFERFELNLEKQS
jgi:PAS domain S-box-containing protein